MTDKFEWNDENTATITESYEAVADLDYNDRQLLVAQLAHDLGVSVPRVRSKLVNLKVYIPKEAKESAGVNGTSKAEYVKAISAVIGVSVASFESATKKDLKALWMKLGSLNDEFNIENANA